MPSPQNSVFVTFLVRKEEKNISIKECVYHSSSTSQFSISVVCFHDLAQAWILHFSSVSSGAGACFSNALKVNTSHWILIYS